MTLAIVVAPARALVIDRADPRYHQVIPLKGDGDLQPGEIIEVESPA